MIYEVALTAKAESQLEAAFAWWAEHHSVEQAARWYDRFGQAIISLGKNPQRCPQSPEADDFSFEVRDLYFGLGRKPSHRAVFVIREKLVLVIAIRHTAQREMTPDDI